MTKAIIGIIGGSGVYELPGLEDVREERVATPWGEPSDALRFGRIGATEAVFLPRHGRGHVLSPSGINYRANIDALKRAGVTDIVSVSACGSFKPELYPGLFVLVDQFVDRTLRAAKLVFRQWLRRPCLDGAPGRAGAAATASRPPRRRKTSPSSTGGTYVCMEGPQFSSLAESRAYKADGYDVIGMTAMPEAKLAREAEISYATIAMVTDFDCWHPEHDDVDVASVIKVVDANAGNAAKLLARLLRDFPAEHEPCPVGSDRALDNAMLTPPAARDPALMKKLEAIMQRVNRS